MIDYSHELKLQKKPWVRTALLVASILFVVIGLVGIFVPLLPTTPFLLVAAACYARSSKKAYNWLMNHKWFGPPLRQWHETRTIPRKAKIAAGVLILISLGTSLLLLA
jgi:uncharacterized membrane protein YbaN (DUF454 family)